jgi:hypothetical protein
MTEDVIDTVVVDDPPVTPTKDIIVVASNPQQMQTAQKSLVEHFKNRVTQSKAELATAIENTEQARKSKWRVAPFEAMINKAEKNVQFYEKMVAALEAGYVIVPNFDDIDIFAIRTTRRKPKENVARGGKGWVQVPDAQISNRPALGEGRYVDADTRNEEWDKDVTRAGETEKSIVRFSKAIDFNEVDFPFKVVKPEILEKTRQAMKLLAFDDIGVLPSRRRKRGDPMVIGRIWTKNGNHRRMVSFLITWFVNTADI